MPETEARELPVVITQIAACGICTRPIRVRFEDTTDARLVTLWNPDGTPHVCRLLAAVISHRLRMKASQTS